MPSQKILAEKQEAVATLAAKMRTASAGVLVKYEGITVEDDTKLRAALRAAGVEYAVLIPVGRWVIRIADSVLLTCCPPAPLAL